MQVLADGDRIAAVKATLIGVPGSHPTLTAELALERKGIPFRRIDIVPGMSRVLIRLFGVSGNRVPVVRVDGQRLQGSRVITRALDVLVPDPPLFPADPGKRAVVESAERWGEEVLQDVPRRLAWASLKRDRSTIDTLLADAHLGIPTPIAVATSAPVVALSARLNRVSPAVTRADLERLPALLDRVDELIAEGVIGGPEPNAADLQIAPSVRLLWCMGDIRPALEGRPSAELAERVAGRLDAELPPVFPAEWLAGLRSAAPSPA
jgi:glutathione S-transferase